MIRKVEHTAIIVKDMDESINFYSTMFGFKLRSRGKSASREMAFLYHDNQPGYEIELIQDLEPIREYAEQGLVNHLAFTVDDMTEAITYYKNKGITFLSESPNTNFEGRKTIFFHGPNKELLQLVEVKQG